MASPCWMAVLKTKQTNQRRRISSGLGVVSRNINMIAPDFKNRGNVPKYEKNKMIKGQTYTMFLVTKHIHVTILQLCSVHLHFVWHAKATFRKPC